MSDIIPNAQIPATGGAMAAYMAHPVAPPRALVLMQVELWGMTAHMKEVAERLAGAGYSAVVCDLFRGAPPPRPSDPVAKWAETFQGFDDVRATRDSRMALEWALEGGAGVAVHKVFAWGFCMGGRFAHNLAAFDRRLAGAINFYGRVNFERLPNKPFLPVEVTRMIEAPYLGAFAETDDLIPPQDVERLRRDLSDNPDATIKIYPGAEHAFFNDHRETYHAQAVDEAWRDVLAFLQRHG